VARQVRALTPLARDGEITLLRQGADRLWRLDLLPSLCLGGLVLLGVLFYVWQHIQVVRLGYEIEQLQGERIALLRREKELRVDLARLKSLRRVEEIARRQLGLTTPVSGQVITVE
jgi:cell division protein FtsL